MKKLFLSFLILTAFATASLAQLSGGIRAGLNLTNQKFKSADFDISETGDMKAGFQVGLYLVGNLSDNIAFQPEIVYSGFGANDPDGDSELGYISIPVLLRYNFNDLINLHLGPQFGILASAEFDGQDAKDLYNGLDMGVAVGLGVDFGPFNAGARYYAGLANVADNTAIGIDDAKFTNSAIQLVVGYRLFGE
mgnify:CR=1 FL=1